MSQHIYTSFKMLETEEAQKLGATEQSMKY